MDKALFKKVCKVILVKRHSQKKRIYFYKEMSACPVPYRYRAGRQAGRTAMNKILSVCFALLVIFASSVPLYCQSDSLVDGIKTVDGHVVSVDLENSKIVVRSSEVMTFSVPSDANIIDSDGFSMELAGVGVGDYVTVSYHNDKSGDRIMNGMEVEYKS